MSQFTNCERAFRKMGLAQSRDGVTDPIKVAMIRQLARKASVSIALQQQGEIEAGGIIHGYVEINVRDPKEIELTNDPRDRYKFSYADLIRRNEVHFSSISVELIGEVNTRVRFGKQGHGQKLTSMNTNTDPENDEDDKSSFASGVLPLGDNMGMISGHVLDSHGIILRTNLPTQNQAHDSSVLFKQKRVIARAVTDDLDHLFNSGSFVVPESTGDEIMDPGIHRFPFAFTVPEDAPSTCTMIRSYNGDNCACCTARLVVVVEVPYGPGDEKPAPPEDVITDKKNVKSESKTNKKGKKAIEVAMLPVHSVPLVLRSKAPVDPALAKPMPVESSIQDSMSSSFKFVRGSAVLSEPVYNSNGQPSNPASSATLAPLHSHLLDGGNVAASESSNVSAIGAPLQPFVVQTQRLMSCCCLPLGGKITLQARSDKYTYLTSETPIIEWEIHTKSSKKVEQVCVELVRKCEWKAKKHRYESELILSQITRNAQDAEDKLADRRFGHNNNLAAQVQIPLSDPGMIVVCSSISTSMFSVSYYVRVTARIYPGKGRCFDMNPVVHVPIFLYSRFSAEMGLNRTAASSRLLRSHSFERFPLNSLEIDLMKSALREYLRLFSMYGGVNYSTHGGDNIVPNLVSPITYVEYEL